MRNNLARLLALAALASAASERLAAQDTAAKPLSQDDLLRQIETLSPAGTDPGRNLPSHGPRTPVSTPANGAVVNARATTKKPASGGNTSLFPEQKDAPLPTDPNAPKPEKKAKGPTEIVALEATFDQKTHIAVFIGQVVVTDPEFTVQSDKLTAYLKHDDKPAPGAAPKPATPAPTPSPDGDKKAAKGGGLDSALAEADPGNIVTVTQEKQEADGTTSHSIGHGKKAHYDANTGDIILYGHPDVQQGVNTCVASEESTVMTLNRDGRMHVTGPHKTVIADQGGAATK